MGKLDNMIRASIATAVMVGLTTAPVAVQAEELMEKCYGVSRAGKNDCQTSKHTCAGYETEDGNPEAWLFLPKGTCDRLVSGSTSKPEKK